MRTLARTLMEENANLLRQIETKTEQYANVEARVAAVERENIPDQLSKISAKINEIKNEEKRNQLVTESKLKEINRKEPVIAFRVTSVKDSEASREADLRKHPGKIYIINDVCTMLNDTVSFNLFQFYSISFKHFFKLFGKTQNTILEVD